MNNLDRIIELQKDLIAALERLRWIEYYVRRVVHDDDGCEIEAWVGRPGESTVVGTPFRADTLAECIDMAMAAQDSPSLDELAQAQGVKPMNDVTNLFGTWPGEEEEE